MTPVTMILPYHGLELVSRATWFLSFQKHSMWEPQIAMSLRYHGVGVSPNATHNGISVFMNLPTSSFTEYHQWAIIVDRQVVHTDVKVVGGRVLKI